MWLYAAVSLGAIFPANPNSPLSVIGLVLLLSTAFLVARHLDGGDFSLWQIRLMQLAVWVAVTYCLMMVQLAPDSRLLDIAWPLHFTAEASDVNGMAFYRSLSIIAAFLVWWRGLELAMATSVANALEKSLLRGTLVIALAATVHALVGSGVLIAPIALCFFGVGLLGLAMARIEEHPDVGAGRTWWYRLMGGTVAMVLIVGVGSAWLIGSAIRVPLLTFLEVFGNAVRLLFSVILGPFVLISYSFFSYIWEAMLRLFGGSPKIPESFRVVGDTSLLEMTGENDGTGLIPSVWLDVTLFSILSVSVILAMWFLARVLRRRVAHGGDIELERESLWVDVSTAGRDLGAILAELIPRWYPKVRPPPPGLPDWGASPKVIVFGLYIWLCHQAAIRGISRQSHETPLEFERRLIRIYPTEAVVTLTSFFNRMRYGGYMATREELNLLRRLWG